MRELDKQIAAMTAALKKVEPQSRQTATMPNPTFQTLENNRVQEAARAEGLRAEVATLDTQLAAVRRDVAALNEKESAILSLETERDLLTQSLRKYIENREQARVTDQMAAQQISSVRVYQEPTFNAKPVAPKKRLIAMAGLVFAAFGALGLALVLEYKSVFFPPAGGREVQDGAAADGADGRDYAEPVQDPRYDRGYGRDAAADGPPEYADAGSHYGAADTLTAAAPADAFADPESPNRPR